MNALSGPGGIINNCSVENIALKDQPAYFLARAAINSAFRKSFTDPIYCFGDSEDIDDASMKCVGECLERFSLFQYSKRGWIHAKHSNINGPVIAPDLLNFFSERQYNSPNFPHARFQPDLEYDWIQLENALTSEKLSVPVDLIYPAHKGGRSLVWTSSTGMAVHRSKREALKSALLELVERDALAIVFLARLPGAEIEVDPAEEIYKKISIVESNGYEVKILEIRLDVDISTILALAYREQGPPYLLRGASASLNPRKARDNAFRELWRSFLYYSFPKNKPPRLTDVHPNGVEYNLAYYQTPMARRWLGFLFDAPEKKRPIPSREEGDVQQVLEALSNKGFEVYYYDCTLPQLDKYGLKCIKAFIPGLQWLSFGRQPWCLGGKRAYELPLRLGKASKRLSEDDLNVGPHFFS